MNISGFEVYRDIAKRTGGDIYIGVVGPVRSGKSSFIKRFMDLIVLPNIPDEAARERARDETPQSAAGRTIMTTEPKFIPEHAAEVIFDDGLSFRARLVDCVGYMVDGAIGSLEEGAPRMVKSPWFENEVPFDVAAKTGTDKVIREHSTVGLVITADGSFGNLTREGYEKAEKSVITEIKATGKPFAILLNCADPFSEKSDALARSMQLEYDAPVLAVNCLEINEEDIRDILRDILYEFPVRELRIDMPAWINTLANDHWLRSSVYASIEAAAKQTEKVREVAECARLLGENEYMESCFPASGDLGSGSMEIKAQPEKGLFYRVLGEAVGEEIADEKALMKSLVEFSGIRKRYERVKSALDEVEATGYGIVLPTIDELALEEPEIVKQGGKYGVRLRASAPSIHMLRADIMTEVSPTVGSEKQSEELVMYLLREFEENPQEIWSSNMFGKSLHELVNEGLHAKLYRMPAEARGRLQETLERVINEGCSGLICIIL